MVGPRPRVLLTLPLTVMPLCNWPVLYACNKPRLLWFSYVYFRVKESGVTDVVCLQIGIQWTEVWRCVVSFCSSTLGAMKRSLLVSSNGLGDQVTQNEPCHRHDNPLWYFSFRLDAFSWNSRIFLKICRENSSFTKIGQVHEDPYTFLITSRSIVLRMEDVSDKICREN